MSNRNEHRTLQETWPGHSNTHFGMLLDPTEQSSSAASDKVVEFENQGGEAILIGGSGHIDDAIFQGTVNSVVGVVRDIPIIIFPGHTSQIPVESKGITGVLNYQMILGSGDSQFNKAFPLKAREQFQRILDARGLNSLATLYILCGDPSASVSKVSGIKPANLNDESEQRRVLEVVTKYLNEGIQIIFFDTGSRAQTSVNRHVIQETRVLIDNVAPDTFLFVGGGITGPEQAGIYKDLADCISIGTYFERNGVVNVAQFIAALSTQE